MKKKYNAPSVQVVKVQATTVLAGSIGAKNELGNGTQLGKRGNYTSWDEEE